MGSTDRQVFVNCPFDGRYANLLRAIVFGIAACRYEPRCALEVIDAGQIRLDRIMRTIRECGWSVHDISRRGVDRGTRFARFNVPFELGIDVALQDSRRRPRRLILGVDADSHPVFFSDIAGFDVKAHGHDAYRAATHVRNWLQSHSSSREPLPSPVSIIQGYRQMLRKWPTLMKVLKPDYDKLTFNEYVTVCRQWVDELAL